MKPHAFHIAFALGALALLGVATAVATSHLLVLGMTAVIGAVYVFGALELRQFRATTAALNQAMGQVSADLAQLHDWLITVPADLQHTVRQRIEGERLPLPGPALTPYLIGLLVMLGMLGTFLGMVVTLNGAVFALEGSNNVASIRAAFSEPIKGLGIAFGTSVAGVATSAMLGLMNAMARRERVQASQALDALIASSLRRFSLVQQRQDAFAALQQQALALPHIVAQLQTSIEAMADQMAHTQQQTQSQLLAQQQRFHQDTQTAYTGLAQSVDQSLRTSLSHSLQLASDGIRPMVQDTLTHMTEQVDRLNAQWQRTTQEQLGAISTQLQATSQDLAQTYRSSLAQNETAQVGLQTQMGQTLEAFSQGFEQRSQTLLRQIQSTQAEQLAQHHQTEQQRLDTWHRALDNTASTLGQQWQQSAELSLAQQQALCDALAQTAQTLSTESQAQARQTQSEITRLIETASEAPKAAAEVIAQLRQEISHSVARDNNLLEERTRILSTLSTLLDTIGHASTQQRGVIDALLESSQVALTHTREQFQAQVNTETDKLGQVVAQVSASAVDVASLSDTLGFVVRHFSESNDKLVAHLQRLEQAIQQSLTRSDEQMAYYVAQAREMIDLSITSQQDVLQAMQSRAAMGAEEAV